MRALQRARVLLAKTEQELRDLAAQAVAAGDYDGVQQLANWAKQLGLMAASGDENPDSHAEARTQPSSTVPSSPKGRPRAKSQKSNKSKYPRFAGDGDQLVKVSWSKKKKKEYQHRAPREVLEALLIAMDKAGARHQAVMTDDVFPISSDGAELPSYQAYLALAYLRQRGAVKTEGRGGYRLEIGTKRPSEVAGELWAALGNSA